MYGNAKKTAWVNGTIIVMNVLFFLYLEMGGSSEDTLYMKQHGAMFAPLVVENREYYRCFTAMFMHFGINHLANNMLILFVLGDNMERALGHVKYLIFYLLCGAAANVVSMMTNIRAVEVHADAYVVGAGASGAIFGVVGGLLYAVIVNKGRLEDLSTRQLVIMILFSLYFGFTSIGVDNVAHIAGLIVGIILGVVMYRKPRTT